MRGGLLAQVTGSFSGIPVRRAPGRLLERSEALVNEGVFLRSGEKVAGANVSERSLVPHVNYS